MSIGMTIASEALASASSLPSTSQLTTRWKHRSRGHFDRDGTASRASDPEASADFPTVLSTSFETNCSRCWPLPTRSVVLATGETA